MKRTGMMLVVVGLCVMLAVVAAVIAQPKPVPYRPTPSLAEEPLPKSRVIDLGEIVMVPGWGEIGVFDLDGFDTVSVNIVPAQGQSGTASFFYGWRIADDMPFTPGSQVEDCVEGGGMQPGSFGLSNQSIVMHMKVYAPQFWLYCNASGPSDYRARVVLYLRRTG